MFVYRGGSAPRPRPEEVTVSDRVPVDGGELEYDVQGSGEPVLLIHGSILADAFTPLLAQPTLTDHYRLIHYHRRGFGSRCRRLNGRGTQWKRDDCSIRRGLAEGSQPPAPFFNSLGRSPTFAGFEHGRYRMRVIDWVLPTSMQSRTAPSVIGSVARVNGGRARVSSPRYLAAKCVS